MSTAKKRITRLRNRITRNEKYLAAIKSGKGKYKAAIFDMLENMPRPKGYEDLDAEESFEVLVDYLADRLDGKIQPKAPVLEWLSDIAIDIAAYAAVSIYFNTEKRVTRRLARLKKKLAKLEAKK